MSERAERLREAMAQAVNEPYPPNIFRDPPTTALLAARAALEDAGSTLDGLSAHTIRECVGKPHAMERVARAIVSELGITREMVEAAEGPIPCNEGDEACYDCQMQYATVRALECLLDAAGVQP